MSIGIVGIGRTEYSRSSGRTPRAVAGGGIDDAAERDERAPEFVAA